MGHGGVKKVAKGKKGATDSPAASTGPKKTLKKKKAAVLADGAPDLLSLDDFDAKDADIIAEPKKKKKADEDVGLKMLGDDLFDALTAKPMEAAKQERHEKEEKEHEKEAKKSTAHHDQQGRCACCKSPHIYHVYLSIVAILLYVPGIVIAVFLGRLTYPQLFRLWATISFAHCSATTQRCSNKLKFFNINNHLSLEQTFLFYIFPAAIMIFVHIFMMLPVILNQLNTFLCCVHPGAVVLCAFITLSGLAIYQFLPVVQGMLIYGIGPLWFINLIFEAFIAILWLRAYKKVKEELLHGHGHGHGHLTDVHVYTVHGDHEHHDHHDTTTHTHHTETIEHHIIVAGSPGADHHEHHVTKEKITKVNHQGAHAGPHPAAHGEAHPGPHGGPHPGAHGGPHPGAHAAPHPVAHGEAHPAGEQGPHVQHHTTTKTHTTFIHHYNAGASHPEHHGKSHSLHGQKEGAEGESSTTTTTTTIINDESGAVQDDHNGGAAGGTHTVKTTKKGKIHEKLEHPGASDTSMTASEKKVTRMIRKRVRKKIRVKKKVKKGKKGKKAETVSTTTTVVSSKKKAGPKTKVAPAPDKPP